MKNLKTTKKIFSILMLFCLMIFAVACSSSGGDEPSSDNEAMEEMDHDEEEMDHDEEEMDHDDHGDHGDHDMMERIPNPDGVSVVITSPQDGDTFAAGEQIIVDVEVENFALGEDGNHWHVYVDGTSYGMVMGGNTDQPLTGVEPGEHEISVFIANGDHEEFEDGDSITVTVEE